MQKLRIIQNIFISKQNYIKVEKTHFLKKITFVINKKEITIIPKGQNLKKEIKALNDNSCSIMIDKINTSKNNNIYIKYLLFNYHNIFTKTILTSQVLQNKQNLISAMFLAVHKL